MNYFIPRYYILTLTSCFGLLATGNDEYVRDIKDDINDHFQVMNKILKSCIKCFESQSSYNTFPTCIPFAGKPGSYANHLTFQFKIFGIPEKNRKSFESNISQTMEITKEFYNELKKIESGLAQNNDPKLDTLLRIKKRKIEEEFPRIRDLNKKTVEYTNELLKNYQRCINKSSIIRDITDCKKDLAQELIMAGIALEEYKTQLFQKKY